MATFNTLLWMRRRRAVLALIVTLLVVASAVGLSSLGKAAHAQGIPPTLIPPTLEIPQPPAVFGDIYNDANGNGVYDWPEERGIKGADLQLIGPSNSAVEGSSLETYITESDANGFYYFTELPASGLYTLIVDLPYGYIPASQRSYVIDVGETTPAKVQVDVEVGDLFIPLLSS